MSFPRGRAHRILPFSRHTHATVSTWTGTILPHSRETWPRQTLPAPGTWFFERRPRSACHGCDTFIVRPGFRPRTCDACRMASPRFSRHTHATVSTWTGTILPHSRETWPRQTLPAPGTWFFERRPRSACHGCDTFIVRPGFRPRTCDACRMKVSH